MRSFLEESKKTIGQVANRFFAYFSVVTIKSRRRINANRVPRPNKVAARINAILTS